MVHPVWSFGDGLRHRSRARRFQPKPGAPRVSSLKCSNGTCRRPFDCHPRLCHGYRVAVRRARRRTRLNARFGGRRPRPSQPGSAPRE
jgi:hypothetical protein